MFLSGAGQRSLINSRIEKNNLCNDNIYTSIQGFLAVLIILSVAFQETPLDPHHPAPSALFLRLMKKKKKQSLDPLAKQEAKFHILPPQLWRASPPSPKKTYM